MLKENITLNETDLKAYQAAREGTAIMDRSAWDWVQMSGEDRVDFLHRMSTNEVRDLTPGRGRRTILTTDIGRIVAVVTAYAFPEHLLLLTHPQGAERVVGHLRRYIFFRDRVRVANVSDQVRLLSVWGPAAASLVGDLVGTDVTTLPVDHFIEMTVDEVPLVVARMEDLGLAGFHLIVQGATVDPLWDRLVALGAQPMSEPVYEVLRVEAGWPAFGRELGDAFNPLEAGLKSIISFTKGCYIGQEVVARLDTYHKVKQHLVGIALARLPEGVEKPVLIACGKEVGFLTSWVASPAHGPIALGYVLSKALEPGLIVDAVDARGKILGQVVNLPFSCSPQDVHSGEQIEP